MERVRPHLEAEAEELAKSGMRKTAKKDIVTSILMPSLEGTVSLGSRYVGLMHDYKYTKELCHGFIKVASRGIGRQWIWFLLLHGSYLVLFINTCMDTYMHTIFFLF